MLLLQSGEIRILELLLEYGWAFLGIQDKKGLDSVDYADKVIVGSECKTESPSSESLVWLLCLRGVPDD